MPREITRNAFGKICMQATEFLQQRVLVTHATLNLEQTSHTAFDKSLQITH
jgi:hypothetical protein